MELSPPTKDHSWRWILHFSWPVSGLWSRTIRTVGVKFTVEHEIEIQVSTFIKMRSAGSGFLKTMAVMNTSFSQRKASFSCVYQVSLYVPIFSKDVRGWQQSWIKEWISYQSWKRLWGCGVGSGVWCFWALATQWSHWPWTWVPHEWGSHRALGHTWND